MNRRIQELADQASLHARADNSSMLFENFQKRYTEKFAELIVKECMNLVTYVGHSTRGFDCCGHVRFTNEKIKENFGVEE